MKVPTIIDDDRLIACIGGAGEDALCYNALGKGAHDHGITQIVPYRQMGDLWFAVFKGAHLYVKVQGKYVAEVFYADPPAAIGGADGDE